MAAIRPPGLDERYGFPVRVTDPDGDSYKAYYMGQRTEPDGLGEGGQWF